MAHINQALASLKFFLTISTFCSVISILHSQEVEKIEPPFWWANMASTELQLMIYGKDLKGLAVSSESTSVKVINVHNTDSPNYLFVDLDLSNALPGNYTLSFSDDTKVVTTAIYEFKKRKPGSATRKGIDASDAVYLITPDRFANGDNTNDEVVGLREGLNRSAEYGRHGGDIQGIRNHLHYIKDLGFTAIWLNPVLVNDQEKWSYHGYSTTDYYKVDPRFGSNEEYADLAKEAADMGIGIIMDIIVNHCGSFHLWMEDPPFEDWINQYSDKYQQTNHRKETLLDPYRAESDRDIMTKGWFVPTMPGLNQRNEFMSTYLIQNSIWWIEHAHLSAIRQDTYSYPFREFMTDWTCAIMEEYPNFFIVGEEWIDDASVISYWQQGKENTDGYSSCLPGLMDFPLCFEVANGLVSEETWDKGLIEIYKSLSRDYLYADPSQLVIFPDNHDMKRIYVQLEENYDLFKMAMAFYLTTRGIPQLYYGTEILMNTGKDGSHGYIRSDFPGGWEGDKVSVISDIGLSLKQKEAQSFMKRLLNWRKGKSVIHDGKLTHYVPEEKVYTYFRYNDFETVMVIINKNTDPYYLSLNRFQEHIGDNTIANDIISSQQMPLQDSILIEPMRPYIFELGKENRF